MKRFTRMKVFFAVVLLIHVMEAFEYQVTLHNISEDSDGNIFCGGCILNQRTVLTAAHCLDDDTQFAEDIEVVAGYNMVADYNSEQTAEVTKFVLHPKYDNGFEHDIAVVLLRESFRFNDFVKPVTLPPFNAFPKGKAKFSGWSEIDILGQKRPLEGKSLTLRAAFDCLLDEDDDEDEHEYYLSIDTILCTKSVRGDAKMRAGDSGTPLMQNDTVIGIAQGVNRNRNLMIYTRISAYMKWIHRESYKFTKIDL